MGLDSMIVRQLTSVAKNSGKLDATVDKLKSKVLDKGLGLLEETGIDPSTIPVNIPSLLRGEISNFDPKSVINSTVICAQPIISSQKRKSSSLLISKTITDVEAIYVTTNNIKQQLIQLQQPVNALNKSIGGVANTVNSISTVIKIIKRIPVPTAIAGVGIPINVLTIYSSVLDSMDKLLTVAKSNLNIIPKATLVMSTTLNNTIQKVNSLNVVIDPLLQFLQLCSSIITLQDNCPLIKQSDLDNVKDNLLGSISGTLATTSNIGINTSGLEASLLPKADPGYYYKNFRFTLESDPNNKFNILTPRRILCSRRNSTGFNDGYDGGGRIEFYNINNLTNEYVPPGSYSYSSDINTLVAEAKFAVDVYTDSITTWSAPQIRPNNNTTSTTYVDFNSLSGVEQIKLVKQAGYSSVYEFVTSGFFSDNQTQLLPTYIIYGGRYVNLNSTPNDIEFGASSLMALGGYTGEWYERDYNQGSTPDISSYIQSGTIQVNGPINIKMKTFGGTGNPIDGNPRFTEAILTIKRSFNIQDDVNPFTGKIIDSESVNDNIESFENKYGKYTEGLKSIDILNTVYETFNEGITMDDDVVIGELTQILENGGTVDPSQLQSLSNRQQLLFIETVLIDSIFISLQMSKFIDEVYKKFYFLLPNKPTLALSEKIFSEIGYTNAQLTNIFAQPNIKVRKKLIKTIKSNQFNLNINWWRIARYTQHAGFRNIGVNTGSSTEKAISLSFLSFSSRQWIAEWNNIYGSRENYNNGAWVGGSSDIPIIPTQVGLENDDITIPIDVIQIAGVGETINEIVGGLDLIGTYSYDLYINDSIPKVGGEESFYPTNYTTFTIEDNITPSPLNPPKQTSIRGY